VNVSVPAPRGWCPEHTATGARTWVRLNVDMLPPFEKSGIICDLSRWSGINSELRLKGRWSFFSFHGSSFTQKRGLVQSWWRTWRTWWGNFSKMRCWSNGVVEWWVVRSWISDFNR